MSTPEFLLLIPWGIVVAGLIVFNIRCHFQIREIDRQIEQIDRIHRQYSRILIGYQPASTPKSRPKNDHVPQTISARKGLRQPPRAK
jgi:hypothetical protein